MPTQVRTGQGLSAGKHGLAFRAVVAWWVGTSQRGGSGSTGCPQRGYSVRTSCVRRSSASQAFALRAKLLDPIANRSATVCW